MCRTSRRRTRSIRRSWRFSKKGSPVSSLAVDGPAQLQQRVDRDDHQQRRRVETRRRTWEPDRADRVTEDGADRVAKRIQDTEDDGAEIERRADPTHVSKRKWGEHG